MPNYSKIAGSLSELLAKLPKGSTAAQEAIRLEMELEAARQAALYAPHTLPTETGAAALEQAKKTLGKADGGAAEKPNAWHELIGFQGKTRAGTPASPTPLDEQLGRTTARIKGFMNDPEAELKRMVYQYLPASGDSPEEQERKLNELAMGVAGSTKVGKVPTRGNYIALPLNLPRARPKDFGEIDTMATRMARQMEGEHVTSGKPKSTDNLANRSYKESQRVQNLPHTIKATKNIPKIEVHEPKVGDIITGLPGDQTISDQMILDVNGVPINSQQQGGSLFGFGHLDLPESQHKFWASNLSALDKYNKKLADLADIYGPDAIYGMHIAMGRDANNFAQHFADANLKYIHASNPSPVGLEGMNKVIREGHAKFKFPDFPGLENMDEAYEYFKNNSEARKWFNDRMKVPKVTNEFGLPSGLDIEWAITEPELRNKEINLTGMSVGKMRPYEELVPESGHHTYSHDILGTAKGRSEYLVPFELQFPDAAQHIASTQPPASFSGTLQKVFPHQKIDQQLIDEIGAYRDLIKFYTGKKEGGLAEGGVPEKRDVSQLFPLKVPADNAELKPEPKYPLLEKASQGVQSIHDFVSAPFGYENPAGEMVSSFLGVPAVAKTMENIAYGTPLTTGSGMTTNLRPETAEAAMAVAPLVGPAVKTGTKVGKALAPTAAEMALDIASKYGVDPRMNIIKPKGGNWMPDTPERMTEKLKTPLFVNKTPEERLIQHEEALTNPALTQEQKDRIQLFADQTKGQIAVDKWVDQKLNKYIKSEMGTESDPIRLGIERRYEQAKELRAANQKKLDKMAADIDRAKARGKDTTLSENDLAAAREKFAEEEDIAFNGLYHGTPPEGGWANYEAWYEAPVKEKRKRFGMPEEGLGTHPASRLWESTVDDEIGQYSSEGFKAPHMQNSGLIKNNPWLLNLPPDTTLYKLDTIDGNLEFRHMIDELKNALDPLSNLPKHLKIAPKDLEKMTVDDVSALSGKINAWRNVQKTKTNLEIANNPATHTFKEYPLDESNPKGVSWRQIKRPEGYSDEYAEQFVRDAVKYEGDIMRHCVGGSSHCEPLLNGEVELYTLRDAKGEPHVTIEVEVPEHPYEIDLSKLDNETKYKYQQYVREWRQRNPEIEELTDEDIYAALREAGVPPKPPRILEIKGKLNRKPKDEYIPFIQDFIKSGRWSDIKDIHHTDLRKAEDVLGPNVVKELRSRGEYVPPVLDFDEAAHFHEMFSPGSLDKYLGGKEEYRKQWNKQDHAEGGAVRMADGGAVNSWQQMISSDYNTNPDMKDGGSFVQAPAFAKGGAVNNAWINLIEGAQNA